MIALVREHLKPGEFTRSETKLATARFGGSREVRTDLLYRVAKADSLGRNADWIPREKCTTLKHRSGHPACARISRRTTRARAAVAGRHLSK